MTNYKFWFVMRRKDGSCRSSLPPTWRSFAADNQLATRHWEGQVSLYSYCMQQSPSTYGYWIWLMERIARRRFMAPERRKLLWEKMIRKYPYGGTTPPFYNGHQPFQPYFHVPPANGEHGPVTILSGGSDKPWADFCPHCGAQMQVDEWRFDTERHKICVEPTAVLQCNRCGDLRDRILDWVCRRGPEVQEARDLRLVIKPKIYEHAPPIVGYLDFLARLKHRRSRRRANR